MSEHELWNELGNLYFMSAAYEQAAHAYQRSIEMDSDYGRPYSNLALTYVRQAKYDEAVTLFRRSLDLLVSDKEKAISWNRLGKVYRHLKDYEKAVAAFQMADELAPDIREDDEDSEEVLFASSGLSQALSVPLPDLSEVADSDSDQPPDVSAVEIAADAYSFTDSPEPDESTPSDSVTTSLTVRDDVDQKTRVEFSEEAQLPLLQTDVEDLEDKLVFQQSEPVDKSQELKQYEVQEENSELSLIEPSDSQVVEAPSDLQSTAEMDDLSESADFTDRSEENVAVNLDDSSVQTIWPIENDQSDITSVEAEQTPVESYVQKLDADSRELGDFEMEIEKYKRVLQINNRSASAWDALGTIYRSAGLYKEAIFAHRQAASIDSNRAAYHHHLALALSAAKRDEDAIAEFQKVIELAPDHYLAHATLGGFYRKLGLEELAQKHISKALKYFYDTESEYNHACLEAICGNVDQALELLQIALQKKQTYIEWVIHDPDLDFIRDDLRFKQLISNYTDAQLAPTDGSR